MRVLVVSDKAGVSEFYRAVTPYRLLAEAGDIDLVIDHGENPAINASIADFDAVVFSRTDSAAHHVIMMNALRSGVKTIFDIDDNLFLMPPSIPVYSLWFDSATGAMKSRLWYLKQNIKLATKLTVSTEALGRQLCNGEPFSLRESGGYLVLPNQILAESWDIEPAEKPDGEIWVGWWGIYNHWDDWRDIAPYIEPVILGRPDVRLVVLGFPGVSHLFPGLRESGQLVIAPFVAPSEIDKYRAIVKAFDIALAPTSRCAFNESKSDLKVLQYGAAGVPVIASMVTYSAWAGSVMLVNDSGHAWETGLQEALRNLEDVKQQGRMLQNKVLETRTYERNYKRWLEALN